MYQITEEQKQQIINTLLEMPAKYSINLISFIQNLQPVQANKEEVKDSNA